MTDDIASENDVRDDIDIEGTSARCTYALVVADPDCQDTARAHKQVRGSSGSTRVHSVDLLDLGGLGH